MKARCFNILTILFLLTLSACNNEDALENEISQIEVDFEVERFDLILTETNNLERLSEVKQNYPFLFPRQIKDTTWLSRIKDDLQQQMFKDGQTVFGDFNVQKDEIEHLFQHIKYYDKAFNPPKVITVSDNVDYRNKLVLQADLLIINLMNYLGEKHEFYQNIPLYFAENMVPSQIVSDIAEQYAKRYAYQSQRKTLLDEMIYYGKLLYFKDILAPELSSASKIGYLPSDVEWAKVNEAQIWSYFVEKEMLFSTNSKLFSRFTAPAPFTKFYLDIDNQSPGRLGQYIGWQIVKAYAERTDADIMTLMRTDTDEIFKNSKYKPKR
ncbi:MAG: gliding motility lipoprotein GldB [Winogradskyella sp.]|uniref:gliding motility lipoprotein GldB n=1 Tax=Winogradskyella sp. TaxID=1883156 RepID=UPI0017A97AB5|nr:gliding motility lipoprotein GldB [Winogradskyella sp.]MBT8244249.1 gliding motility lipoprotein GldB [Winogradskyella sp.]NNK23470.1 gliding motility lipoprotein GldB [Winogradskyella sp.]